MMALCSTVPDVAHPFHRQILLPIATPHLQMGLVRMVGTGAQNVKRSSALIATYSCMISYMSAHLVAFNLRVLW
jgi:hypothetical protein